MPSMLSRQVVATEEPGGIVGLGTGEAVGLGVSFAAGAFVEVLVGTPVAVDVDVAVDVFVGVLVGMLVGVEMGVAAAVDVGVWLGVAVLSKSTMGVGSGGWTGPQLVMDRTKTLTNKNRLVMPRIVHPSDHAFGYSLTLGANSRAEEVHHSAAIRDTNFTRLAI
jgi:hypothetical protein